MRFFTADTHFFHKELIHSRHFANRDFLTVSQMNDKIISSWNAVVDEGDTVYHLGDIAFIPSKKPAMHKLLEILKQLKGQIVFIKGNHDNRALFKFLARNNYLIGKRPKFVFHDVGIILKFDHYQFFLTHYPLIVGPAKNRINLHGHIHNSAVNMPYNINVGVDSPEKDYLMKKIPFGTPFSEREIIKMVTEKKIDYLKRK